jgi:hypothetical protein
MPIKERLQQRRAGHAVTRKSKADRPHTSGRNPSEQEAADALYKVDTRRILPEGRSKRCKTTCRLCLALIINDCNSRSSFALPVLPIGPKRRW